VSNSAFHHKDSKISTGLRCALGIMLAHFNDEGMSADSVECAAGKMTPLLNEPSKLGRSHSRRNAKMHSAIEVGIERGLLRYSGTECRLTLTREGRKQMKCLHKRRKKMAGKPTYVNEARLRAAV